MMDNPDEYSFKDDPAPVQKQASAPVGTGMLACPSCGKRTFLGDYCEFCNSQLLVICGNPKCKAEQRIGR